METLIVEIRRRLNAIYSWLAPYFRQLLRFLALPYCLTSSVDWNECPRSWPSVAADMLYIFFRLGYYPDNYGKCRLWEIPRSDWRWYYGSGYNPFQRARLSRKVQRPAYKIMFHDKQVAQLLAESLGIRMPGCRGYIESGRTIQEFLTELARRYGTSGELIIKPVLGKAGRSVYKAVLDDGQVRVYGREGELVVRPIAVKERFIVQDLISQHPGMARFSDQSLNTLRMLTLLGHDEESLLLAAFARFGVGPSVVDNWSAGGIAVGIEPGEGKLRPLGFDKRGRATTRHPTSGVVFEGLAVPFWREAVAFARRIQSLFPFYGMLGLDVAITQTGPVLVEINPSPDLVLQEQTSGPLFRNPRVLLEFADQALLTRQMVRWLRGEIERARGLGVGVAEARDT
jgi:hypothetical protein